MFDEIFCCNSVALKKCQIISYVIFALCFSIFSYFVIYVKIGLGERVSSESEPETELKSA